MPRDPDDGLPGQTPRDRPNKPPSQMTPAERKLYNAPDEMGGYRKGGAVKKTGPAKVHKGEEVVKKSSAQKYGPAKMAAVNKGTAKVTVGKKR